MIQEVAQNVKLLKIYITRIVQIGANIKIFSARSARFEAIIKFRDKIYTPENISNQTADRSALYL